MGQTLTDEVEALRGTWDLIAEGWDRHIGRAGDRNRVFHIGPALWPRVGPGTGTALDAGCGTGWAAGALAKLGYRVRAVDFSPEMVRRCRANTGELGVEVAVDDCMELATVPDASVDLLVSVYVLQDLPDHRRALAAFHRVLRPGGRAFVVFGHPLFGWPDYHEDGTVSFRLESPYVEEQRREERWAGTDAETRERFAFGSSFVWFHRPLSSYWRAFRSAGFTVADFDEPVGREVVEGVDPRRSSWFPWSVLFELRRPLG